MDREKALDWLLAASLATSLLTQIILGDAEGSAALNIVGGLLLTLPLAVRRRAPLAVIAIFGATAILNEALGGALFTFPESGAPEQDVPLFGSLVAGMVAFYSLGAYAEDRPAAVGGLLGLGALWATVFASEQVEFASFIWSGGLVAATPWFAGRVARSRRQRIALLELEQEQRTQLALAEERARIARELHDVVAHSVGVIVVQAQGGRSVIRRDPQRAEEALATIESTARTALGEMRQALGVLRGDDEAAALSPQPGIGELDELVAGARAGGLPVELTVEGEPRPLPPGVDLSVYRIVQEALTNALKHAERARTKVTLRYGERDLEIVVTDEGPGPQPRGPGEEPGHGLMGMRERVAAHAGELETSAAPGGGFRVHATLPIGR